MGFYSRISTQREGFYVPKFNPSEDAREMRDRLMWGAAAYLQIDRSELITLIDDCGFWPVINAIGQHARDLETCVILKRPYPPNERQTRGLARRRRERGEVMHPIGGPRL